MTSRKTAAKETKRVTVCRGFESHLGLAFFRVSSGFYRNIISCNKYEERHKELASICSLIFFFVINSSRVIQAFLGKRDELERRYCLSSS